MTDHDRLISLALGEDLGATGDVTSEATVPAERRAGASIVARQPGAIAGAEIAARVFTIVDPQVRVDVLAPDGSSVAAGDALMTVTGRARSILTAERTALNFLGHLSGVATATRRLVDLVAGTGARITDTRKTTPGLRALEKAAVRAGGGSNHRFGLSDAVLIKDNHIAAAGSVAAAVAAARTRAGHTLKIEVEVENLDQLEEALTAAPDIVMLDNMSLDDMRRAVERAAGRCLLEASGGITEETVRAVAETGVGFISVGWITHSAPSLDVSLELLPLP